MREKRPEKIAEMLRIHSSGFCHSREQQCSYFGDDHCGQHLAEDAAEADDFDFDDLELGDDDLGLDDDF